jgi:hypothetical protein
MESQPIPHTQHDLGPTLTHFGLAPADGVSKIADGLASVVDHVGGVDVQVS